MLGIFCTILMNLMDPEEETFFEINELEHRCEKRQKCLKKDLIKDLQSGVLVLTVSVCNGLRMWHKYMTSTKWYFPEWVERSSGIALYLLLLWISLQNFVVIHSSAFSQHIRRIRLGRKFFNYVCLHLYFYEDYSNLHIHV